MSKKYSNFVKPLSSSEVENKSISYCTSLSGDEARKIYLNEIGTGSSQEPIKINLKTDRTEPCPEHKSDKTELSQKDLFMSAQNDDIDTLRIALNNFPDKINCVDEYGWSLLMIACQANSIEVAKELLKRGADTSIRDKAGNSAQNLIIKNKNYHLADIFLRNKICDKESKCKSEVKQDINKIEEFFCDICNIKVNLSKDDHLSSTIHNINLSKDKKIPPHYVIPQNNRGYQMMLKVGWDRESGLGPDGRGKKYPIKTIQKQDRKGLGHGKRSAEDVKKSESIKFKNKRTMARDHERNRRMEANFRRQFY